MTKLQFLNAFFAERLMAAMQEIMQVVEGTLIEYQEENDRTKRENEILRRRLRGAGLDNEAANLVPKPPPPLPVERVSEQQQWGSTGPGSGSTLTAVKLEFPEPQRNRREEEEEHSGQEEEQRCGPEPAADGSVIPSPCSKRERDQDSLNRPTPPSPCSKSDQDSLNHPTFPSPRGKRDRRPDSRNLPDLRLQIGNPEEEDGEPVPNVTLYQVKTERLETALVTDGVDCDLSVQPTEPIFLRKLNAAGEPIHREEAGSLNQDVSSLSLSLAEQHPEENPNLLQDHGSLACVYCGKVFFLPSRLKAHLKTHTEDSSYRCSVCGKCFSQSGNLNVHQRIHTGHKPYSCNICGKSFNYSGKFREHQRIHTGERPYRCSFCGKYFSQSGHLKAHVRIHTGEKPYRCPVCGSCFSQLSQIKRHLLSHTQEISVANLSLGGELC